MSSLIGTAMFIGHTSMVLLTDMANGVKYLIVRNYDLVSFLIRILTQCCNTLQNILIGLYLIGCDFVDQYGDFCILITNTVWNTITLISRIILLIIHLIANVLLALISVAYLIIQLITNAICAVISVVLAVLQCPLVIYRCFVRAIDWVQSLPDRIIGLIGEGLSLLGCSMWDGMVGFARLIGYWTITIFDGIVDSIRLIGYWTTRRNMINRDILNTVAVGNGLTSGAYLGMIVCVVPIIMYKYPGWRRVLFTLCGTLWTIWFNVQPIPYLLYQLIVSSCRRPSMPRVEPRQVLRRLPLNSHSSSADTTREIISPPDRDPERYLCVVCQDNDKSVMVHGCNHVCMCKECADSVFRRQGRCPICRSLITRLIDVYL